jgi:hypothetical protein
MVLSALSGAVLWQSTCFLESDFDPRLLIAEAASTLVTDAIFFALDAFLFNIS